MSDVIIASDEVYWDRFEEWDYHNTEAERLRKRISESGGDWGVAVDHEAEAGRLRKWLDQQIEAQERVKPKSLFARIWDRYQEYRIARIERAYEAWIDRQIEKDMAREAGHVSLFARIRDWFTETRRERVIDETVRRAAIEPEVIMYVQQTETLCQRAAEANPETLNCIDVPSVSMRMEAVARDWGNLQFFDDQTPEMCQAALRQDPQALRFVKDQTPEMILEAVRKDPSVFEVAKVQTPEICLEAVKKDGMLLEQVWEQTPEVALAAVRQNGMALRHVWPQTPEICLEAVKQNGMALKDVCVQTPEICLAAVQKNGHALKYVKDQTPEIVAAALAWEKRQPYGERKASASRNQSVKKYVKEEEEMKPGVYPESFHRACEKYIYGPERERAAAKKAMMRM